MQSRDRHYYTEGKAINVCVFCGGEPQHPDHIMRAEAQPTSEGDSLRAALARCHTLLQDAGHWTDMDAHAEWHEAMDKELLPCDEAAVCPTVPTSEGEEREAFEAWCRDEFGIGTVLRKSRDGFYDDTLVQLRWLAWQARSSREGGKR